MKKICVLMLGVMCLLPLAAWAGDEPEGMDEMAAWMAANQPGEHHEHLGRLVGHWTYTTTGPMGDSEGTMKAKSMFDGRYVMHTWKGQFMGSEFVGHGLDGYDNAKGKYVSAWVDNFSTGIQMSYGKCANDDCTEMVTKSEMMGPDGSTVKQKSHTVWDGNDSFTMKMYMVPDEGDAVEQMTLVATRHVCDETCEHHDEHYAKKKHMKHEMKEAKAEMEAEMEAAEEAMEEAEGAMEMAQEAMEEAEEAMEEAAEAIEDSN